MRTYTLAMRTYTLAMRCATRAMRTYTHTVRTYTNAIRHMHGNSCIATRAPTLPLCLDTAFLCHDAAFLMWQAWEYESDLRSTIYAYDLQKQIGVPLQV